MDKLQIAKLAQKVKTREDLLSLLNRLKMDDMTKNGQNGNYHPFSINLITYYSNPNHTFHRFKQFKIKKKTKGYRTIDAPKNPSFKLILYYLNKILQAIYIPSDYAMGFTEGRSVVTNASVHKGQKYIFNTDIKDFFPSIFEARIIKRLQMRPFNFPESIALLIAGMCCKKAERINEDGSKGYVYILPQGSPTSPIITNMICDKLDHQLAGVARRFGLLYTRYADDITFSSMHNVYQENGEFQTELKRIIEKQGFHLNDEKTRLQTLGGRQEVTGLIISKKLNVSQKYVRDLRNILFIWEKYGYYVASSKFLTHYKADKGHLKHGKPDMINVIDGKLMYLKMVKGDDDPVFIRLFQKFSILSKNVERAKYSLQNVSYLETIPLTIFEKKNNTTIKIIKKSNSTSEHRFAAFQLNGKKEIATINKGVNPEDECKKDILSISLCRNKQNQEFWLLHRIDKVTRINSRPIDIEELNKDLDSLLTN